MLKALSAPPTDVQKSRASPLLQYKVSDNAASETEDDIISFGRLSYPLAEELPSAGTLIAGRYLLVDLIHPHPLKPFAQPEREPEDLRSLKESSLQLQIRRQPSAPILVGRSCSGTSGKGQSTGQTCWWQWQWRSFELADPPIHQLLLLSGIVTIRTVPVGDALAAAVISVHSELAVSRKSDNLSDGLCIDPYM